MTNHGVLGSLQSMVLNQTLKKRIHLLAKPQQFGFVIAITNPSQKGQIIDRMRSHTILGYLGNEFPEPLSLRIVGHIMAIVPLPGDHSHDIVER
ncbi:hypothetical protein CISIN_1g034482mg [Citrus sinensis]|uniref:Uncharacterized protein n=1 Tax=Citrus sinensis TaxID=2711 RepID=A0A067GI34_CITSI|nr:hypothetical protein CISIN_1g034482mg [Citrus sinensis]